MNEQVKQDLLKMIAYQKKDIELRRLNDVLKRDAALIAMNKNKSLFNDAKAAIKECEDQAGDLLNAYAELCRRLEENEAALAELEGIDADAEAEEAVAALLRKVESLRGRLGSIDKKLHDIEEQTRSISGKRQENVKRGSVAKQKYAEARDSHAKLVGSKKSELDRLNAELARMRGALDPKLYAEYERLVQDNKFPPVVQASAGDKKNVFSCGGCGLGLPQKSNATLADEGWCYCDNCRRIIVNLH